MPSRWVTVLIVAGWVACLGWLFAREVYPWWAAGAAPPFDIDLADEAVTQSTPTSWIIRNGDRQVGKATTTTSYRRDDDTFEMSSLVRDLEVGPGVLIPTIRSAFRVDRRGELREVDSSANVSILGLDLSAAFDARVIDGQLRGHVVFSTPLLPVPIDRPVDPVPAPKGSMLNPLQPLNRLRGLRPGTSWIVPMVNPLSDLAQPVARALLGGAAVPRQARDMADQAGQAVASQAGPKQLRAEVLPEPQTLDWYARTGGQTRHDPCLVVEYHDAEGVRARTWVRRSDDAVLRQEVKADGLPGGTGWLVMQRD